MHWKSVARIGLGLVGAALLWKGYKNTQTLDVTFETVDIPDLPAPFDGFRLMQLSDMHLRQHSSRAAEVLRVVEDLNPDLVCMTGDYAFTALSLPELDAFFHALVQQHAVVGVLGNADYRPEITDDIHARWGEFFPLLSNSALPLQRQDANLWIAGVDDPHDGRDSVFSAMERVPEGAPTILLAHSPEVISRPLDPRIRLILCGHTHGGQICLPNGKALYHNTSIPRQYSSGRHQVNGATLYVSRGIGSTRLPLRFGCLPEVTVFTLRKSNV